MARPRSYAQFATDAAYVAPAQPWDGQPTKQAMPAGLQAEGYEPNTAPAAQHLNWLLNTFGQWVSHFRDLQYQNWSRALFSSGVTAPTLVLLSVIIDTIGVFVYGMDSAGTNTPRVYYSYDGRFFTDFSTGFTTGQTSSFATPSGRKLAMLGNTLLAITSQGIWRSSKTAASWALASNAVSWLAIAAANGVAVVVGATGSIRTSPDGVTWTTRTSGVAVTLRDVAYMPATGTYPSGIWVTVGNGGNIRFSNDGGANWFAATSPTSRDLSHVVWSQTQGQFLAFSTQSGGTTVLIRSVDGIVWTIVNAAFASGSTDISAIAELNGVVAVLAGGFVFFSPDGNADWTLRVVDSSGAFQGLALSDFYGPYAVGTSGALGDRVVWNGLRAA
jgi:hypothetical protein